MRLLKLPSIALLTALALPAQAEKIKAVTTFTVIADMAQNVAGDAAEVVSITKPGAEVHYYQPTPGDLLRAVDADVILRNGMNLETWFERFLRNIGEKPSFTLTDGIAPISITSGPYDGNPNPHAWMSASDALVYVDNIRDAFSEVDPANAETYAANAAAYKTEIEGVVAGYRETIAALPENHRWLVTSEGAFSYLARDLGLNELYLWPINADAQGSPSQVRAVIDGVREHDIPVVFSESTVPPDPAEQIARETDARYGGVLYVDSLSEPDGPVPTYLDLLKTTAGRIVTALEAP
ncbi:metal ABC transporter substrate-binding protein [Paracoccaceae bacterium GXU_MW_L88]